MTPPARVAAAIELLDQILAGAPAEKALTHWGRANRYAGSKDRAAVRDHVFDALRCRRSLAAMGRAETGRGIMIGAVRRDGGNLADVFSGIGHAPAVLTAQESEATAADRTLPVDLPDWLYALFVESLGDKTLQVLDSMKSRAPVFLRVNLRRGNRAGAMASLLQDMIVSAPIYDIKTALQVTDNARKIQTSHAYLSGLVEVQDGSSQQAVLRLPLQSGQRILDYCAGGGGKALAIAALVDATLFAHDADPARMADLGSRAARAGVQLSPLATNELTAAAPFDLVLIDAPCSGSGTWRRTPDAKWRLTANGLDKLCRLQADILQKAAPLVRPGGVLAYATCSVLAAENRRQAAEFLLTNSDWMMADEMQLLPSALGDGFYLAVMRRAE